MEKLLSIKKLQTLVMSFTLIFCHSAMADNYQIDQEHSFVQFRVKHLGISWLHGQFTDFSGSFSYDLANSSENKVTVNIKTVSVDTGHAERNKHIRSDDFLAASKHPNIHFAGNSYVATGDTSAQLTGDLTFNGVTKSVTLQLVHVGGGKDPWGGFRQGFEARTTLQADDFGLNMAENLGPAAAQVELILSIEGIRE